MRYGQKLGEEGVRRLLVDHEDGLTHKRLAAKYGVSETTLIHILREWKAPRMDGKDYDRMDLEQLTRKAAPCGTTGGHAKHIHDKTPPCIPCMDAHNFRQRLNRARKKMRAENAKKNQPKMLWQAEWK